MDWDVGLGSWGWLDGSNSNRGFVEMPITVLHCGTKARLGWLFFFSYKTAVTDLLREKNTVP
jgi:hypothetical protein